MLTLDDSKYVCHFNTLQYKTFYIFFVLYNTQFFSNNLYILLYVFANLILLNDL